MEQTLAIIKPDGMNHICDIIKIIYQNDMKIDDYKLEKLDKEVIREHYSHLLDKSFYKELEEYMTSSVVALMILSGDNAVEKFRALMGPTDSSIAPKNTIRGLYGTNKTYNAVHGSDSIENAKIEIDRFFKTKKLINKY